MRKIMLLILILPMVMVSQESESFLLNMSEITVKYGHTVQFMEGVKSWKKCYKENDGKEEWNMWRRVQGKGSVFTLTSAMLNWAEMDEDNDPASKACRMNVVNSIRPHVESIEYNIARSMPDFSIAGLPDDTGLVWVYNAKVNNSTDFKDVIKQTSMAFKKAEDSPRGVWYGVIGGAPEVSDYFVAIPYKNFADLDKDRDNVWEVFEKVNGKKKTDELRAKLRACVDSDWSYMYELMTELSF